MARARFLFAREFRAINLCASSAVFCERASSKRRGITTDTRFTVWLVGRG